MKTYTTLEMLIQLSDYNESENRKFQLNYPNGMIVSIKNGWLYDVTLGDNTKKSNFSICLKDDWIWTEIIPKTKLTSFEYQLLVNRPEGYDWVAKDERDEFNYGGVYFFETKPVKEKTYWYGTNGKCLGLMLYTLSFLSWEDNEPTYIPDLLENFVIDDRKIIIDGKDEIELVCVKDFTENKDFIKGKTYIFHIDKEDKNYPLMVEKNENGIEHHLTMNNAEQYFRMK